MAYMECLGMAHQYSKKSNPIITATDVLRMVRITFVLPPALSDMGK